MFLNSPVARLIDLVGSEGIPSQGLVSVRDALPPDLPIDEQVAIVSAQSLQHIDYIFFRRFTDQRSAQVAAYIVDNTTGRLSNSELAQLHRQVWLHGVAPLLYIAWPSRIDVLSCIRQPDFWRNEGYHYSPAGTVDLLAIAGEVSDELQRFSVLRLADGTFWEESNQKELVNYSKAAHQSLIQAIVETDSELKGETNPTLRRLLLLMVLIKYLEDRRVFPSDGWFGRFRKGARGFLDVLRGGDPEEVHGLLDALERKFNGDVFVLPSGSQRLTKKSLSLFADLVETKTLNDQRYLWDQFSFERLPVEVISHLYQRFVEGGHGAVYTPPFLANLLLDHAMPYAQLKGTEKVLDPACGSGVFLVGAFRRLISVWRSRNSWKRPSVDTLKGILKQSIYGIELDQNAIELTAFSLCLAICDALQPEVIWRELRFDRLRGSNLIKDDFFGLLLSSTTDERHLLLDKFDVVIGNPPFESRLSAAGKAIDKDQKRKVAGRGSLPDNQTAFLFFEQALHLVRANGRVCLIQPSGFLYNRNTKAFRASIFREKRIELVLDFTSIRSLYDEADPKTVAVLASASPPPPDHSVDHWTFRRTFSVQERICFELDHYDRHQVTQHDALAGSFVWRINLLGGGRLHDLARRFREMRTLKEYVEGQDDWDYGEGFIAAKTGKRARAPFLTGMPLLPTGAFTETGLDESKVGVVTETHFRSSYTAKRFSPPLLLIKEVDTLPVAFWDNGFLAYRDKIVGIHAPQSKRSELLALYSTLRHHHDFYRFLYTLNGSQQLIGKATATLKQDIDLLPYPSNSNELSLAFWEKVLQDDVLSYMGEYIRLGQNSAMLQLAANADTMNEYSELFLRLLGSVYPNLKRSTPIFLNGLICQPYYFGDSPQLTSIVQNEKGLRRMIYEQNHSHLRTIRVLRLYLENVLVLIKPDRLRYWIRSTAIQDADETLTDLHGWGY